MNSVPGKDSDPMLHFDSDFVRRRLDQINGSLMEEIESDVRLQHGVPAGQRASEIDFLQMPGLTRPQGRPVSFPPETPVPAPPSGDDLDPAKPVSFYEKGVADVDQSMTPGALESVLPPPYEGAEEAVADRGASLPPSRSVDALKAIVADLAREAEERGGEASPIFGDAVETVSETEAPPVVSHGGEFSASAASVSPLSPEEPAVPEKDTGLDSEISELSSVDEAVVREAETTPEVHPGEEPPGAEAASLDTSLDDLLEAEAPEGAAIEVFPTKDSSTQLEEAEQLLRELESQTMESDTEDYSAVTSSHAAILAAEVPSARSRKPRERDDEKEPRLEYDYSAAPGRGRRSKRHSRHQRRLVRRAVAAVLMVALCAAGYMAYRAFLYPAILSPEQLLAEGARYLEQDRYEEAARVYQRFINSFPDSPSRPEAQFNAAFALFMMPGAPGEPTRRLRQESFNLFAEFASENPHHEKRPRAETLMGMVQFDLGNYKQVIELLREPARQLSDPNAALPILRKLAMAYRMTGDFAAAESTYLQAAVLPKNYSPDVDYYELGVLFQEQARLAQDPAEQQRCRERALEYWRRAAQEPGIDPSVRANVNKQIELLKTEIPGALSNVSGGNETSSASAAETAADAREPEVSREAPGGVIESGASSGQAVSTAQEPNPVDEAQHLRQEEDMESST